MDYYYKYKNEVGCRDDTVPKIPQAGLRACNNLAQPSKTPIGLRKIVACSQPCLHHVYTNFGTVSSLHPTRG